AVLAPGGSESDLAAGGVADGVDDQVVQQPGEPRAIGVHLEFLGRPEFDVEQQPLAMGRGRLLGAEQTEQRTERKPGAIERPARNGGWHELRTSRPGWRGRSLAVLMRSRVLPASGWPGGSASRIGMSSRSTCNGLRRSWARPANSSQSGSG